MVGFKVFFLDLLVFCGFVRVSWGFYGEMCINPGGSKLVNRSNHITNWKTGSNANSTQFLYLWPMVLFRL